VGVLHDATAVCVAHGLTDVVVARPIHFEKKEEIEGQRTNWKSCLVIDWGDSGFTATILKKGGGDTASSPLEIPPPFSKRAVVMQPRPPWRLWIISTTPPSRDQPSPNS